MASKHECGLRTTLSTLAAAALLAATVAGSPVFAQTATLQPPASGLKTAPRAGQAIGNTPATTLAAPANAPLVAPLAQSGLPPGVGTVRTTVPAAGAKKYVLKAQVVSGTSLNATQKVSVASAALADMLKQASEQQDNVKQQTLSQVQNNVSVATGPTLSAVSPKTPTWTAFLYLNSTESVDFRSDTVSFSKDVGGTATCFFTVPEDGYYMALFAVVNQANKPITLTVGIGNSSTWVTDGQAAATLNPGANIVSIVQQIYKGSSMRAELFGKGPYDFKSCEISRIK